MIHHHVAEFAQCAVVTRRDLRARLLGIVRDEDLLEDPANAWSSRMSHVGLDFDPQALASGFNDVGLVGRMESSYRLILASSKGSSAAAELRAATLGPQSPSRPEEEQTCSSV
jgi:hypothetical protein